MEVVTMIDRPLYVDKIMAYVDTPFVKILTGVRRCGKSTILKMIMERLKTERNIPEDRIISCRFDSMEYEDMTAKQIYTLLKEKLSPAGKTYLFLDEVQEIKGWEKIVNSLASDFDVDLYITGSNSRMMSSEIATYLTGSNSRMMSSEIATYLTGRYVSFRIFTLSFGEYLMFKSKFANVGEPKTELANYVRLGGFPATHLQAYSQDEIYTIVRDIYNSTIFSDIVKRNQVRKIDQLERVVKYTFSNVGNTFSAKSIADYLKSERRSLDNETVYSYLDKLEKAYLLHRCSRYDLQGKEILKTQEKFYLADVALRYSVLGYNADSVASSLENIVYLELCRRGYTVYVGKTSDGEIDFVAVRQNEKIYVQVTQEINSEKTEKREYNRLLEIPDNYPKFVLTTDEFAGGNYEGIKTMHIADFLLSAEY
jgi:predicted AAA+ superfamily ATPase